MKNRINFLVIISFIGFISCGEVDPNKHIDEGEVKGEMYSSEELGWSMEIPQDWDIVTKDKQEANQEKGREAIEEAMGEEIEYGGLKHLISFQQNQFNNFQSSSEPFELAYEGEYEDNNEALKGLLWTTYKNQGINVDTSSLVMSIDGLEFQGFHITLYGPNNEVMLNQDMYSRYINGFDFGAAISYNNEESRKVMEDAFFNSTFTLRD